jgi:hypothetical protein
VGIGQILPYAKGNGEDNMPLTGDDNMNASSLAKYVYPIKGSKILFEKDINQSIESVFPPPPPPSNILSWSQFHYDSYKTGFLNVGNIFFYLDGKYTTGASSPIRSSIVVSPMTQMISYGSLLVAMTEQYMHIKNIIKYQRGMI